MAVFKSRIALVNTNKKTLRKGRAFLLVILGEICLVFEFSWRFTLAFGHSFSKFIYSLSLHKFIKKTSPLQEKNTIKGIFFYRFLIKFSL